MITRSPAGRALTLLCSVVVWGAVAPRQLRAQEPADSTPARRRPELRGGTAFSVGTWNVSDPSVPTDVRTTTWPVFMLSLERGRGHAATETTIGLWRRTLETDRSDGVFGNGSSPRMTTYVIPLTAAAKLYPLTRPRDVVEPFIDAGAGLALGVDHSRPGTLAGSGGTHLVTGLSLRGGGGLQVHLSPAVGLELRGGYLWTRYGDDVGVTRTFDGFHADLGLVYRVRPALPTS